MMKFNLSSRFFAAAAIALAGAAMAPSDAFAATGATVNIGGTVTTTLNIVATPDAGAATLDLSGGVKTPKVATLAIDTNNSTGYTLTATNGDMVNGTATTPISYLVSTVNAGGAAPTAFAANYTYSSTAANAAGAGGRDLYIQYTPAALQDPGTYAATITLAVTDN
ncbi:MAG: hypothetical protein HC860_00280 [Alkalinema sp. RU_4_3]|nr:hypothetical protein [Alkalinema sp. RU_4_3]